MFNKFMLGIKTIRVFKGMSQKDVSERAGIKESTYNRFEQRAQEGNPKLDTLVGLAAAVGMDIESVLYFVDDLEATLKEKNNG